MTSHCHFVSFICRKWHKKRHLARVCCTSKPAGRQGTGKVDAKARQLTSAIERTEDEVPLLQLGKGQAAPITVDVRVNDVQVTIEVDISVQQRQLCHASNTESYFHKPSYIHHRWRYTHCREGGRCRCSASSCGLLGPGA